VLRISFFLVLLFTVWHSRAGKTDSLQNVIAHYKKVNVNDSTLSYYYTALIDAYRSQEPYRGLLMAAEGKQKAIACGDRKGLASIFNKEGNIYFDLGLHASAVTSYYQCLLINSRLGDWCAVAYAHNDIGYVYYMRHLYHSALIHFRQAVPLVKPDTSATSQEALAHTYNNMALTFQKTGMADSAYRYFQKALLIRKRIGNPRGIAQSLAYLGRFSAAQKRHTAAERYLDEAITLDRKTGERILEAYAWRYKAEHALNRQRYSEAIEYYRYAIKLLHDTAVIAELIKTRLTYAVAFVQSGNRLAAKEEVLSCLAMARKSKYYAEEQRALMQMIDLAVSKEEQIDYQRQFINSKMTSMQDLDQQMIRQLENIQMVQSSRLNQLIQYKNDQIKTLEKRANVQARQFLIALLVFIVLLTIILLATINFRRKTEEAHKRLQKENALLSQESAKYYATIIRKLEQPVSKHNELIMALSGKQSLFSEANVLNALRGSEEVIKSAELPLLNVIYWARYKTEVIQADTDVPLRWVVEQALQSLQQAFSQQQIKLINDVDSSIRVKGSKSALQLIFRNLLDNALLHTGLNGAVRISAREKGKMIEVSVRDNGRGMPSTLTDAFDISPTGHDVFDGMGLQVSKLICSKSGGDLWIESAEGKGTTVYFTLFNASH
jgi:signal transduction histidine kinase